MHVVACTALSSSLLGDAGSPPQAWVGLPPEGVFNAVKTPLSSIKAVSKAAGSCPPCLLAAGLGGRRRCLSTCRGCLNACHGCQNTCRGRLRQCRRCLEQAGAAVWPLFGRKTPAWRYRPRNRPENSGKGSALATTALEAASKCLLTGAYFKICFRNFFIIKTFHEGLDGSCQGPLLDMKNACNQQQMLQK